MNEEMKQPTILNKIMLIDDKIEKLASILSPIMSNGEECDECVARPCQSITLDRLDTCIRKLDVLTGRIDIN